MIVDGGNDHTDRSRCEAGATTFVLSENLGHGYALRVGYRWPSSSERSSW